MATYDGAAAQESYMGELQAVSLEKSYGTEMQLQWATGMRTSATGFGHRSRTQKCARVQYLPKARAKDS